MFIHRQTQLGWRAARSGVGDLDFLTSVPEGGASSMSVGCRGESIESVLIHATFENEKTAFHRVHLLRRELTDLHGEPAVDKTNADLDRISAVCTEHAAPEAAAAIDDLARQSQGQAELRASRCGRSMPRPRSRCSSLRIKKTGPGPWLHSWAPTWMRAKLGINLRHPPDRTRIRSSPPARGTPQSPPPSPRAPRAPRAPGTARAVRECGARARRSSRPPSPHPAA